MRKIASKISEIITALSVPSGVWVYSKPPVFIPKNPVTSVSGRKMAEMIVSQYLSHTHQATRL